jgi:hypothetical protein
LVDDFIEFLQQNPDLKEELSLFETVSVEQEKITFNKKELLFKEKFDIESEFNQAAVARLEGDISDAEKAEFENYLSSHPDKQKEAELFTKTILQPDKSLVFSKKRKLYRYSAGRTVLLWTSRVAAILIVTLTVYIFIENLSNNSVLESQLASVEKEADKKDNAPAAKELPAKNDKQEEPKIIKEEPVKPAVKKEERKPNQTKIIRENSQGRLINDDLALLRKDVEVPDPLKTITASFSVQLTDKDLVPVNLTYPVDIEPMFEERLLVDVVKEKTGIQKLNFNKITKAGLSLIANLSKEKFNYETNDSGKVTEVSFDSRLLAFSIPTKSEETEK